MCAHGILNSNRKWTKTSFVHRWTNLRNTNTNIRSWHLGSTGYPQPCGIPYGQQFVFWVPHFHSSYLLIPWENNGGFPKPLGPYIHVRNPEKSPDSRPQIRSALAIVAMWRISQQMEDLLSVILPLNKNKYLKKRNKNMHQNIYGILSSLQSS